MVFHQIHIPFCNPHTQSTQIHKQKSKKELIVKCQVYLFMPCQDVIFLFEVGLTIMQGKELKDTFNCRGRVALGSATTATEETGMAKVNQGCLTRPKCH